MNTPAEPQSDRTGGDTADASEQVCKSMCRCGRFQSAMRDKDTLIVGSDAERGEPRGAHPVQLIVEREAQGDETLQEPREAGSFLLPRCAWPAAAPPRLAASSPTA